MRPEGPAQQMGMPPATTGTFLIQRALEQAGVPTVLMWADMVDPRSWNAVEMRSLVAHFIETRLSGKHL